MSKKSVYSFLATGIIFFSLTSFSYAVIGTKEGIASSCALLTTTTILRPWTKHPDVKKLQYLLNLDKATQVAQVGVGSLGKESMLYGAGTLKAVARFQEKYASEILTPSGLTKGTGVFGQGTKKKMLALYCSKATSSPVTVPIVTKNTQQQVTSVIPTPVSVPIFSQTQTSIITQAPVQNQTPTPVVTQAPVQVVTPPTVTVPTVPSFIKGSDFNNGTLRGFTTWDVTQVGFPFDIDKDLSDLASTGANLIRVALVTNRSTTSPRYTIDSAQYASLDQVLIRADRYHFKVVVVIAQANSQQGSYWSDVQEQNDYASLLKAVATKYRDNVVIAGFDIMNEPVLGLPESQSTLVWESIARNIVNQIRSVDTNHVIIIESADWALPNIFYYMKPVNIEDKNIVYSVHMYEPQEVTGQGLSGRPLGVYYPNATYNMTSTRAMLTYVSDFQKKYNVPIYVGEFSAIRWAPGATRENYLRDVLTIFTENKWSWTYHSWRTWNGWDAEIPSSSPSDTTRTSTSSVLALLKQGFSGNISQASTPTPTVTPTSTVASLVASYNMNEGSGATLIDRSGNGRHGTLIGSPLWEAGKNSGGLTFSSSNKVDLASLLPISGVQQLTISAWMKRTSSGSSVEIGKQSVSGGNSITLELWTDGNLYLGLSSGGDYGTVSLNDTSWHHITMVFDGTQTGNSNRLKGYVDGVQQVLAFTGSIPALTTTATDAFGIGSVSTKYSNGQIDDVRVYNRALTNTEIITDMNTPVVETVTIP